MAKYSQFHADDDFQQALKQALHGTPVEKSVPAVSTSDALWLLQQMRDPSFRRQAPRQAEKLSATSSRLLLMQQGRYQ